MTEAITFYCDFKSPYAYLAFDPVMTLPERFDAAVRWVPFQLPVPDAAARTERENDKVRYLFLDSRRHAEPRGLTIKGPRKVYDTTAASIGGLFADRHERLHEYGRLVFEKFFRRECEIDDPDAIAALVAEAGLDAPSFQRYAEAEAVNDYATAQAEAAENHVFGVPFLLFRGEPFWGHDRLPMLEQRLTEAGLARRNNV